MKKNPGRAEGDNFNFEEFEKDLNKPPTNLWLRHLCLDESVVNDFCKYLNHSIARAQAHAVNLRGPEMTEDLLRLQGGIRVLATVRMFVTSFLKERAVESGRTGQDGQGMVDAGRSKRAENSRTTGG